MFINEKTQKKLYAGTGKLLFTLGDKTEATRSIQSQKTCSMKLNFNHLLLVSMWQYNQYENEGLTLQLFQETFGKNDGSHYYDKWIHYFNRNLWDMIAYFRGEGENGQKFCDMLTKQVELYQRNRKSYGI